MKSIFEREKGERGGREGRTRKRKSLYKKRGRYLGPRSLLPPNPRRTEEEGETVLFTGEGQENTKRGHSEGSLEEEPPLVAQHRKKSGGIKHRTRFLLK